MITQKVIIRGIQVAYYVICKTKLWLFSHFISLENENEIVKEGRILHEFSYKRENKDVTINNEISIDFIKTKHGIEIKEIKKSKRMEKSHIAQMKYYMYYLRNKGVNVKRGVILYPKQRKIKEIEWDNSIKKEIEDILKDIKLIIDSNYPPIPQYKSYCKKCAYYDFCFGD